MISYDEFLAQKQAVAPDVGIEVDADDINPVLFPFQRDLTRWALRKGRSAIWADCGLGKTFMQLEWARHIPGRVLILAPLAVAQQTLGEAGKLGLTDIAYSRGGSPTTQITVTNYEMADRFDAADFVGVVLDESSILKSIDGKTKERLIAQFSNTSYRLCCTATPAPNDIAELANHAEFLGICSREEMLAQWFVHDDEGWRLKGHAQSAFYRWLASWGMSLSRPSDLGYSDDGYDLPPLEILSAIVPTPIPEGQMFAVSLRGVGHRAAIRRDTLGLRVAAAVDLIRKAPGQVIVWCGLNDESSAIVDALGTDAVEITGTHTLDQKISYLRQFLSGERRVLVTKPRIAGFGMNLQNASQQVFVGLSDSYESYYQCIRRSWRFGQTQPVTAQIVLSDIEEPIYQNVLQKEQDARAIQTELIANAIEYEREIIEQIKTKEQPYVIDDTHGQNYHLMLGDCVERIREVADNSVDFSIYSPPFASLYTYSDSNRDMGNSTNYGEFFTHYRYLVDELLRVVKPGRDIAVHCQQLTTTLASNGVIGMRDFRGDLIRAHTERGWIYHGEICIDKDPQAQAIRTKSKSLLFVQLRKDSSWLRPALADYILLFRKPGENLTPVQPDISNDEWIEWARPIWYGIRESDTLNVAVARSDRDERHICPLQLGTIERCVRLWSNKGETVLSPFAGIGSEGYVAIQLGRQFTGIELKPEYYNVAVRNLASAQSRGSQRSAFADLFNLDEQPVVAEKTRAPRTFADMIRGGYIESDSIDNLGGPA